MKGVAQMKISKEEMIAIVEHYLNSHLLNTTFHPEHKVRVVDQVRKSGDQFVITFEGECEVASTLVSEKQAANQPEVKGAAV